MAAPSMGRFYNQRIRGTRNARGPFVAAITRSQKYESLVDVLAP